MRFLRRLILLAALAAGAAYLKQLLNEQQDAPPQAPGATTQGAPAGQAAANGSAGNGSGGATKAELYEQAQKLDIEGRSKMTKAELERAIRAAG